MQIQILCGYCAVLLSREVTVIQPVYFPKTHLHEKFESSASNGIVFTVVLVLLIVRILCGLTSHYIYGNLLVGSTPL
jgi:hypothetical protein